MIAARVLNRAALRPNSRKYTNRNPIHRWLLQHFLERVAQEVERVIGKVGEARLLDVGCGEGYVLRYLQRRWPGIPAVGLDRDLEALQAACCYHPHPPLLNAEASSLPFPDQSFRLILCLEVLEHLADPQVALRELARVSERYLLLSVPNQPYFSLANFLRGKNLATMGEDRDHRHHWRPSRFLTLVSQELRAVRISYPFPWVLVLAEKREGSL
jgi:2-polyprenyl-3-methyl-5-hydroxy-6-metoxy-1,4-benzoquinol methylase